MAAPAAFMCTLVRSPTSWSLFDVVPGNTALFPVNVNVTRRFLTVNVLGAGKVGRLEVEQHELRIQSRIIRRRAIEYRGTAARGSRIEEHKVADEPEVLSVQ